MAKLADILLIAMGWSNSHLHAFTVDETRYGMHLDDYPEGEIDEKTVTVLQALRNEQPFLFEYDFGDSWEHDVVVEEVLRSSTALKHAVCLDGANACPPDDVGGTWGYGDFLVAIADPTHEEHEAVLEWFGEPFDPTEFNLGEVNAELQRLR